MRRIATRVGAAALLLGATNADAHLMNSGFGPFYDGLAHPFLAPEDLLPVLALALLAGLRGAACGRGVLFTLPLAWIAGMTAGAVVHLPPGPAWAGCILPIMLGALVAADRPWPPALVLGLAGLAGALHGVENGRELAAVKGGTLAMTGIACALFTVSALIAGQVTAIRVPWARVVVRVAGSWIAAIGMLMFGWTMR